MIGGHGRIVQQHVVKEFKQGQEHVPMMLKTLASHSMSKEAVLFLQRIGNRGQVVQQHAIVALKQEQEHALTIKEVLPMSQKLIKELAMFKTAVVNGDHGEIVLKLAAKEPKQRQKHASLA